MSKIESISSKIALKIKVDMNLDQENYEVIKYGLYAFFQMIFSIATIILIGLIFNVAMEAFIISLAISILRRSSGGVHASNELNCAIIGAITSVVPAIFIKKIEFNLMSISIYILISMIISLILLYKLAPVDSKNKPINSKKKLERLKRGSLITLGIYMILIIINILIGVISNSRFLINVGIAIAYGSLWQSYTLTKSCHNLYKLMDSILIKTFLGRGGEKNEKNK